MSSTAPTRTKATAIGATTTLLGGAGSALLLALTASPAGAATTWTVDTLADGAANANDCITPVAGSCSLRDALAAAAVGDTVTFSPTLFTGGAGTITLTNGQLIDNGVDITGPGANLLTIDADGLSRVLEVQSTVSGTTISGVTITGGYLDTGGYASAIHDVSRNHLILTNDVVTGNSGATYGAIVAGGLTMTGSVVSDNQSYMAGGIFATGNVVITGSTISGNTALAGGGMLIQPSVPSPSISIIDSTISGNTATGAGGGLFAYAKGGSVLIANSTFTGNTAPTVGAVMVYGDSIRILMSTISGNSTTDDSTAPYYSGAGIYVGSDTVFPSVDLTGSVVSGNTAPGGAPANLTVTEGAATGTITAASALIGTGVAPGLSLTGEGLLRSDAPMLGALADNGGPTKTMLPLAGSPLLGAGPAVIPTFPGNANDQRGPGFPRLLGATSTIGAVEVAAPPKPVVPTFTG